MNPSMGIYDPGPLRDVLKILATVGRSPCRGFRNALAERTGARGVALTATGRAALMAALDLLGCRGRPVLVNAYTTDVVHRAILAFGALPVPFDISPDDFSPRMDSVEKAAPRETAAVIHTGLFGFPSNPGPLREWARSRSLPLIGDACNSFGCPREVYGDVSILSFRVGKPLSSGGGALLAHRPDLAAALERGLPGMRPCTPLQDLLRTLRILLDHVMLRPFVLRRVARPVRSLTRGTGLGRLLVRGGVVDTSHMPDPACPQGMGRRQCALGFRRLARFDEAVARRRAAGKALRKGLAGLPLGIPGGMEEVHWNGLFFPVLLPDDRVTEFQAFLRRRGTDVGRFHHETPGTIAGSAAETLYPGSAELARRLVCLPCPAEETRRGRLLEHVRAFFRSALPGPFAEDGTPVPPLSSAEAGAP